MSKKPSRSFNPFKGIKGSKTSRDDINSNTLSGTADTEVKRDESLENKLFHLGLSERNVTFIIKDGQAFFDDPEILAEKLKIKISVAKDALEELKAYQINQIPEKEIKKFEALVKKNPQKSVNQIALLHSIDGYVVSAYLAYSKINQINPFTEDERVQITEKHRSGFSIQEISEQLKVSQEKIKDYVESTFITFNGEEGKIILEIIYKNFEMYPIMKLQEMIETKNVYLQEEICHRLSRMNVEEYNQLKKYFMKFEGSKTFFEINTTLSIQDKTCIRASLDDVGKLSIKLNRMERVIESYLLQYYPDKELILDCRQEQMKQVQNMRNHFGGDMEISHTTYRMIISDSIRKLINNATKSGLSPKRILNELLPLAFYYIKCSLPLKELTQIIANTTDLEITTLDIFHLIFQMSDPVIRGLCIEHYSFSNPVPFYYPILGHYHPEQTSCQFEICKELWYSLQQFSGLVSFGLGWASWNPIGKSHLLDLILQTDFVEESPQNSPFHLGSIDIQMTKNLFGQRAIGESTQWAYIDCHRCSDINVIREICQNLDIALIHVNYSDYKKNNSCIEEDLNKITAKTKHVYVFVRDCTESKIYSKQVKIEGKMYQFFFIPNLSHKDLQLATLKNIGYKILHSTHRRTRIVGSNFLENLIKKYGSWGNLRNEKELIDNIIMDIYNQNIGKINFSSLSYYPHFVNYMHHYYEASSETEQNVIDELNKECEHIAKHLEKAEIHAITWHFIEILSQENSTLILWKLSQELSMLSKQLINTNNESPFTLEILWREALLSSKYNANHNDEGKPVCQYFNTFSSRFCRYVERGEPFELIDGDNLRFFNQDIDILLAGLYEGQNNGAIAFKNKKRPPIVVSIFGPQSSGKSTLLNYCFGCKFLTSAGRCTKGIYASLSKLSRPINNSDHFLILDTEGLDSIERGKTIQKKSGIHFDRTMVLFCLAVSQVAIINVRGDLGEEMRNLLQICAYSLNKLKVSKVAAPKIFFVLNQQADPDPDKHLSSINTLLEKLNEESDLMETEGLKIPDLIQVSKENLFVLPSAFNSRSLNTITKLFDSDLSKSNPTGSFADKCADLRMSIIRQLKEASYDNEIPFNTMSEWMEISGVIWDTIIKYQDIVKYRNTDEIRCSNTLSKILNDIMKKKIHSKKDVFRKITKVSIQRIKKISKWSSSTVILEDMKESLDDKFKEHQEEALKDFAEQCQADSLLKKMDYMCDEAKSNLRRLIYMEKKIYEDKLKLEIKARLTEIKLTENMKKFQEAIDKNADKYLEFNNKQQKTEFEKVWVNCFQSDNYEEEQAELEERFDNLYSVFMMESRTMENKQIILNLFRDSKFRMNEIIEQLRKTMLSRFCGDNNTLTGTDQFIYPWKENRVPIKAMAPYTGKSTCEYLTKESLFTEVRKFYRTKTQLNFKHWVPRNCVPLINYCSGYYNHPDITWNPGKKIQILSLASKLKDPNNFKRSTWHKFISDISQRIQNFTNGDPSISHSTVKVIVDFLCHICKVINYEINFIEAKLTNAAERTISTYAFALAFESLLNAKMEKQEESILKENKEKEIKLNFFLKKIRIGKAERGNWDRIKMREGAQMMANKYAEDFLSAVWREVNTDCEQNTVENFIDEKKERLSHKSILLLANAKIKTELNNYKVNDPIDEENIIIQYTCNRNQTMKKIFEEEWLECTNELHDKIVRNMRDNFTKQIAAVKHVLKEFLEGLKAKCVSSELIKSDCPEGIGLDADGNFEVVDETIEINTHKAAITLKAMVLFLEMYLNPKVSPEDFEKHYSNVFEINGVKLKKHYKTYVLFEKPQNLTQVLDEETFNKLTCTNMFRSTETIFNIYSYVEEFLRTLNDYEFQVTKAEYENLLKSTKDELQADVTNCPHQCPSCGKFCERKIHPHAGRCQILTGHQICSMGGKVWNTNEDKTAILIMCEDYKEDTQVAIPGQNMKWWEFKENCDQWDWTLPTEEEYVTLQEENRDKMKKIWNRYGREILKYYANRGTHITYIPYTSPEEIFKSLFGIKYYICFVIDGTNLMGGTIPYVKKWVKEAMRESQLEGPSNFKVIVYHSHHNLKKFPKNSEFTSDDKSIQSFLVDIHSNGNQKNEFAMLHGLATAATESDWKSGFRIKNIIVHFYVEPTDGYFNILTAGGKCDQGCHFDWKRDISDRMNKMDIQYKKERLIHRTHPDYAGGGTPVNDQTLSDVNLQSGQKSMTKAAIFINYETDN